MAVKWTKQQQEVIDVKNREVLVSAAAGSGKTAVLVEHIIQKVINKKDPIDIDELLVVTFTNAAAAEMRERIRKAIEKKAEECFDDAHIQKQLTYIHQAKITTIHSFCLDLIKEHFDQIELDPSFRIGDEGELKLLKADLVKEMLEDFYEQNQSDFITFVESYTTKNDTNLEEMILKIYEYSRSYPDVNAWMQKCLKNYESAEPMDSLEWMQYLYMLIQKYSDELEFYYRDIISQKDRYPGAAGYMAAIENDYFMLCELKKAKTYEEKRKILKAYTPVSLKKCKNDVPDEYVKYMKTIRDYGKTFLNELKDKYFSQAQEELLWDLKITKARFETLMQLVAEFSKRYQNEKKDKNILDFNDLEHYALQILVKEDDKGNFMPTDVAKELSEQFKEIMIDEYQDSNLVQETILRSISKESKGTPNIFMVGDVKQSIYKFRLARPELFMDKYQRYETLPSDSKYIKIMLDRNFRSRSCVLESINEIFYKIMRKDLGNIEYDKANALYPGADYPVPPQNQNQKTEFIIYNQKEDKNEDVDASDDQKDYRATELEAYLTAQKIKELTNSENGFQVWDKEQNCYRTAKYQDIVILFRSLKGTGDIFTEVLMCEGIPAYCETSVGYFNSIEITWLLNFLSIIDNPLQDIEFVSVLRSPFVNISNTELAMIKSQTGEQEYWMDRISEYIERNEDELQIKLKSFSEILKKYRFMVPYTSIYDIISKIVDETNYYNYVLAMPAGKKRAGNIDILKQKAIEYEGTSYVGLFNFIRYIEKLKKYDVDFGEAKTVGENDNTIRIMSIHKSKGLEFPIVIMPALEKRFNQMDKNGESVFEPDLGIGLEMRDPKSRIKNETLLQKVIRKKITIEDLGEQLRILYVAMTRAKEKLIMIGAVSDAEKKVQEWSISRQMKNQELPFFLLSSVNNFLDWIGYVCVGLDCKETTFRMVSKKDFVITEQKNTVQKEQLKQNLLHPDVEDMFDDKINQKIIQALEYSYPYYTDIGAAYSVSDIKKEHLEEEMPLVLQEDKKLDIVPEFIEKKEKILTGAELGTIYHRIFEMYDLKNGIGTSYEQQKQLLEQMVLQKKISKEMMDAVSIKKLEAFGNSSLAKRMEAAEEKELLFREKQFLIGISAKELNEKYPEEETVLVQGVIDVYFEENGDIILADYKTDKVLNLDELVKRYQIQLEYYKEALERMTNKKVKEKIIYSTYLEDEISF